MRISDWRSDVCSSDLEVIVGSLSTSPDVPVEPETPGGGTSPFDVTVRAQNSGKWSTTSANYFGGSEVWAGNTTNGLWVYGNSVRDAVGAGATFSRVEIFLPLISQLGNCSIGLHDHFSIPGGTPSIHSLMGLNPRGGWVQIPFGWGAFRAAGVRGRGVT